MTNWVVTINSKAVDSKGVTVVLDFTSGEQTYSKTVTSSDPSNDWLATVVRQELENLAKFQTFADTLEVGAEVS